MIMGNWVSIFKVKGKIWVEMYFINLDIFVFIVVKGKYR